MTVKKKIKLYLEEGEGGNRQTLICKYAGRGLRKFILGTHTCVSELEASFYPRDLAKIEHWL